MSYRWLFGISALVIAAGSIISLQVGVLCGAGVGLLLWAYQMARKNDPSHGALLAVGLQAGCMLLACLSWSLYRQTLLCVATTGFAPTLLFLIIGSCCSVAMLRQMRSLITPPQRYTTVAYATAYPWCVGLLALTMVVAR